MSSNPNVDLEDIITDAVNDSLTPDPEPEVEASSEPDPTPEPEASPEPEPETPVDASSEPVEGSDVAVPSPGAVAAKNEPQDEFERLAGIPQNGIGGRENRIPYSRVKKITEKAVSESETRLAETVIGRKLAQGEKPLDVVKTHVARIPELETTVKDYESRLNTVGEFEQVMASEPQRFLQMLARVPAYKEFFDFVEQAYNAQNASAQPPQQHVATQQPDPAVTDEMPQPNEPLPDGTMVYDMDGLKALMAWNARQVENRVAVQHEQKLKALQDQYEPIRSEWQERKRIEATLPVIQAQIAEAKTWPLFNEHEAEITRVLELDKNISLEAAYRKVVFPKLVAERNSMRKNVLQEIKSAPVSSTSVTTRPAVRPNPPAAGPRSIEDIIKEQIANLPR